MSKQNQTVTASNMKGWLVRFRDLIDENAAMLTKLDSEIGDADHGSGMQRGAQAAADAVQSADAPAGVLKAAATAFIGKVGGASGPLYGTAFLRMAGAAPSEGDWSRQEFAEALRAGLGGIVQRGKAEAGDKTMLDAWTPAVEALEAGESYTAAALQADAGKDATREMVARKGRASYLGERSKGHIDPGAASSALLFKALADVLEGEAGTS